MKQFINDWCGDPEKFIMNIEENKEYQINTWITYRDSHRAYLMSAYLYDEFVMFFYVYELRYSHTYAQQNDFKIPQTHRDLIIQSGKNPDRTRFEYEVNHLKAGRGSSGECLPRQMPENVPKEEQDEFFEMYFGEYDYLCDLIKDRLPEEFRGVPLAFRKDCYSFAEPVTEIKHMAIYPSAHEVMQYLVDKTFTVPYGECDIRIPYTVNEIQSYIIVRELKIIDMLKEFEERYDDFRKARENSLRELEQSRNPENHTVMDLEEIRRHFDKRLLTISYLKPEEYRSFAFYTTEYLDSALPVAKNNSIGAAYLITPENDDRIESGLYKGVSVLGDADGAPNDEYEIALMSITEPVVCE